MMLNKRGEKNNFSLIPWASFWGWVMSLTLFILRWCQSPSAFPWLSHTGPSVVQSLSFSSPSPCLTQTISFTLLLLSPMSQSFLRWKMSNTWHGLNFSNPGEPFCWLSLSNHFPYLTFPPSLISSSPHRHDGQ